MGGTVETTQLERSMNISIASGAAGTVWMIVCAPQAIFNVFVSNALGATSAQLGLLVGILSFASVFQLTSILIYRRMHRRKAFWIVTSAVHRLNGPVLAVVAFAVANGADRQTAISVVFAAMIVSWILTNISASGWWSWMADLVPIGVRARFFGRRSAVAQIVNVVSFFLTTVALDSASGPARFNVYAVVFLVAGIGGVVDILLHVFIPEPTRAGANARHDAGHELSAAPSDPALLGFFAPVRDRNFLRFSVITGLVLFSINVSAPFFAPYVTNPATVGAPNTWLGIMFVISQTTWIAVSPGWGTIMDRFGRKPAVMIGLLFTVSWLGYLVVSPGNYVVLLPIIAMVGGVLAPAFWDGINQLMLSLTKESERLTYIAWYWTIIGVVSAGGSLVGGALDDFFRGRSLALGPVAMEGFHVVVVTSLVLVGLSLLALSRVDEGPVKPVSYVFSRVANPGIFRTFMNIGVLSRTESSVRVVRTLRSIDSENEDLAVEQVLGRLHDPDPEVREEAVRALGRLRAIDAIDALIAITADPFSTLRAQAARALGRIGDGRAIPALADAMEGAPEELREACAAAIGEIGGDAALTLLSEVLRVDVSDSVAAGGASALSRHGALEAAWEIVPRLHTTRNPVLRTQLAIALANVLGSPGHFYRYVTGEPAQQRTRQEQLVGAAAKAARSVIGAPLDPQIVAAVRRGAELDALVELRNAAVAGLTERFLPEASGAVPDIDRLIRIVYETDPKLGVWLWFLDRTLELENADHAPGDRPSLRLEILIACYFLRATGTDAPPTAPGRP